MLLDKQRDEAHPDWDKSANITFYNGLTNDVKVKVTQSCGLFATPWTIQARILDWVAFPFSRGSSQPRDWTQVSHIAGGFFTSWATSEAQEY